MADQEAPLTSFPLDSEVTVNFDAADIAANLNRQQIFQLIKELDDATGDWAMTCLLARHFASEVERLKEESAHGVPKVVTMTVEELLARCAERDARDAVEAQKEGM